jgi:Fe-S-cluster containining protein
MTDLAPSINDLCLACGLCCTNVVHRRVLLTTDELFLAHQLGLPVVAFPEGLGFSLPCPLHHAGRCTAYERRPAACAQYQCELLQRCRQGEETIDAALALVKQAKELLSGKI